MNKKLIESKISACPDCMGNGYTYERDTIYDSEKVTCKTCNGKRVVKVNVYLEYLEVD